MNNKSFRCIHCGATISLNENFDILYCHACGNSMSVNDIKSKKYSENLKNQKENTLLRLAFSDGNNVNFELIELAAKKGSEVAEILQFAKAIEDGNSAEIKKNAERLMTINFDISDKTVIEKLYTVYMLSAAMCSDYEDYSIGEIENMLSEVIAVLKENAFRITNEDYLKVFDICNAASKKLEHLRNQQMEEAKRKAQSTQVFNGTSYSSINDEPIVYRDDDIYFGSYNTPKEYRMSGDISSDLDKYFKADFDLSLTYDQREAIISDYYKWHR